MNRLFNILQLILSCVIFLCVIAIVVSHVILGNIASLIGYLVSAVFIFLTWKIVRISWTEFQNEK
nr:MAG TPA: hypothetical protein [Caudoviricetes sp.]